MTVRSELRWMAFLVLLAAGVRVWALGVIPASKPIGDELHFVRSAIQIAQGNGYIDRGLGGAGGRTVARAAWPPGHAYFLSWWIDPERPHSRTYVRDTVRPLLASQVVLSTLWVILTALLGRALFDARTGLVAGFIAALYPTFIAFSHYLWSENLFSVLLTGALIAVVHGCRQRTFAWPVLAGALFGAAALTREIAIPFAAACGLWWITGDHRIPRSWRLGQVLAMGAVAGLVVLPWTVRNYQLFDRFVPVATSGWMALREGNTFDPDDWLRMDYGTMRPFRIAYYAIPDELERMDFARKQALELIRAEQPTWILKKLIRNGALLFAPDSVLFTKIRAGAYGDLPSLVVRALLIVTVLAYVAIMVAGVLGIFACRSAKHRALPLLLLGMVTAFHIIAHSHARLRVPIMGVLMIYASHALLGGRALLAELRGRRLVAAGIVIAIFLGFYVPYFQPDAATLWSWPRRP